MSDQLARHVVELQARCAEIGQRLDHFRHAVLARLPGQPRLSSDHNVETFFSGGGKTSSSAAASLTSLQASTGHGGHGGGGDGGGSGGGPVSKEEIGRATWTFLHTLAAQYPERPTRQQKRDAKSLIDILTRMYPCGECARHFRAVVAEAPPQVDCRQDFSMWMCRVHNVVNRSLNKPTFNCDLVTSRWAGIECEEEDACSLDLGGSAVVAKPRSGFFR